MDKIMKNHRMMKRKETGPRERITNKTSTTKKQSKETYMDMNNTKRPQNDKKHMRARDTTWKQSLEEEQQNTRNKG